MWLIIEVDGVVMDVQPAYWAAYRAGVAAVGLAPADARTFWRLIRTGAADEQLLERARPHQVKQMRSEFDQRLASEDALTAIKLHDGVTPVLEHLARRFDLHAISTHTNTSAVLNALRNTPAGRFFQSIDRIEPDPAMASRTAQRLMDAHRPAAVLGASELIVRAASGVEAINIGIASGTCIGKRLAKWGTAAVYPDLSTFADAVDSSDAELVRAGLLIA